METPWIGLPLLSVTLPFITTCADAVATKHHKKRKDDKFFIEIKFHAHFI